MKGTDRTVLLAIPVVVLLLGFYFMVLSPKREEAAKLDEEITNLQSQIGQQEQVATFAEQARQEFPTYYGRMVTLGKAVPEQGDQASMLVQLNSIANRTDLAFRGLTLGEGTGDGTGQTAAAPAAPAPAAPTDPNAAPPPEGAAPPAEGGAAPASSTTSTATATAGTAPPAPATEAVAANLPIGASVGPAGLPTLPYDFEMSGGYFEVADFIGQVDKLVQSNEGPEAVSVNGRLLTVDGFALKFEGEEPGAGPVLETQFVMTSYVTPAAQGLTLGASPGGPAVPSPTTPQATPASNGAVVP
jgi:Tfp pilus assembly protein PilO